MESNTAVAEPEVTTTPENEAVNPGATDATEGTEGTGAVEPTSQEQEPSAVDQAVSAGQKALLTQLAADLGLEGDFNSYDDIKAAQATAEAEAEVQEREEIVKSWFPTLSQKIVETGTTIGVDAYDAEGNPVKIYLTPEQLQPLFPHLHELRSAVRQMEEQASYNVLADAALQLIPEAKHDDFLRGVDGKKLAFQPWLERVAEHAAPQTKAWKTREATWEAEKAKYGAEQWELGHNAPQGQISQNGTISSGGGMTMAQIDDEPIAVWMQRPREEREKLLADAHARANA